MLTVKGRVLNKYRSDFIKNFCSSKGIIKRVTRQATKQKSKANV